MTRGSIELSTRAWNMALKKSSEWLKRTEYLVGIEVKPRAWARMLFPTPRLHQQNMLVLGQELQGEASAQHLAIHSESSPQGGVLSFLLNINVNGAAYEVTPRTGVQLIRFPGAPHHLKYPAI